MLKRIILENLDVIVSILGLFLLSLFFALPKNISLIVSAIVLVPLFILLAVLKYKGQLPKRERFNIFKFVKNTFKKGGKTE